MKKLLVVCILLALTGCYTSRAQQIQNRIDDRNRAIQQAVGSLGYDHYLKTFGPPNQCAQGAAVFVCDWGESNPRTSVLFYGNLASSRTRQSGWNMRLAFDRTTFLLTDGVYAEF